MESVIKSLTLGDASVFFAGTEECEPGHFFSTEFQDRYLIHYIISGKGIFRGGGKEYHLSEGNAFFIGKERGYYEADKNKPWTYAWINFSGAIVDRFLKMIGLSAENPIYKSNDPKRIARRFREIINIPEETNDFIAFSKLFMLLGDMMNTSENGIRYVKKTGGQYVETCCEFIRMNYQKEITIKDLCDLVGLEHSYLYRLFMQNTGMSIKQYIINRRLQEAAALLSTDDMPVNEVFEAVGYGDRSNFSGAFKEKFGISPTEYRKIYRDRDMR